MERVMGLAGLALFIALGWALSRDRKAIDWRTVLVGIALQWALALVVLKGEAIASLLSFIPWPRGLGWLVLVLLAVPALAARFLPGPGTLVGRGALALAGLLILRGNLLGWAFDRLRVAVEKIMDYGISKGAAFVFGDRLTDPAGPVGFVFAFRVLPVIIFVGAIFAILYYLGVMQKIVAAGARVIRGLMRVSGAEAVCATANVFMGQTEAPLTVRPFLARLTDSELMTVMITGMASVSGSIMVTYHQVAGVEIKHLLTAAMMSAPSALLMAKLLEPETLESETGSTVSVDADMGDANLLDAAARGTSEGLQLAINVAAMLISFIALIALLNGAVGALHEGWSLERALGFIFRPVAFLMGVPWAESELMGTFLGKRMVTNEIVAFLDMKAAAGSLSPRTFLIGTYALTGFANFSSIAIQLGGIGALVPARRPDLARLGLRAMLGATMANFMSGCIAGILG
jgi:CNT family concentrative nucleoside transporter